MNLPTEELYDLENDLFEKRNLLTTYANAEIAEWIGRLRLEMIRHMNLPRYYHASVVPGPTGLLEGFQSEQLNDPRQSRGLIFVSPSKGQVHEPPEGG